jgi:hypothetical protein
MKTKDIIIIAGVGVAAYLLLKKPQARPYTITVPPPDRLTQQEYEAQQQRRLDNVKNLAQSAADFISKIFGKNKTATVERRTDLSAGISPVVGPKKIGYFY